MPAGRFVLPGSALAPGAEVALPPAIAHQARDVLRLVTGDTLRLLDGAGAEYSAVLVVVSRGQVVARLGAPLAARAEPPLRIVLCQGMLKAAKFEWVLQKGTELGVAEFVPLLCERAVAATEATGAAKLGRWEKIAAEAIEQCGGAVVPRISSPRPLASLLADRPASAIALFPWEEEAATPLRGALSAALAALGGVSGCASAGGEVRLFIGPEGGFAPGEAALARRYGALPVTLGPRVLRAETAAVVALSLTLEAIGALDRGPART